MARYQQLISLLQQQPFLKIAEICELLEISPATARRDLRRLEEMGKIKRVHGGAILDTHFQEGETAREIPFLPEKKAIAAAAARLVKPGDTVFIDSGSTNNEVAKELLHYSKLTIITNSIEIAYRLTGKKEISVVVCGGTTGEVNPMSSIVGPLAEMLIRQFRANICFLGSSGIDIKHGITDPYLSIAGIKKAMVENAAEIVLVSDHSKFGKINKASVCGLDKMNHLITDDRAPDDALQKIKEMGVNVTKVEVNR